MGFSNQYFSLAVFAIFIVFPLLFVFCFVIVFIVFFLPFYAVHKIIISPNFEIVRNSWRFYLFYWICLVLGPMIATNLFFNE